ncbi:MAG: hypothetical protein ACRC68_13600, partial [Clostridium sp.]
YYEQVKTLNNLEDIDIILFDKDGDRDNSKEDQLTLKGGQEFSDFNVDSTFQWDLGNAETTPNHIKAKFSYNDTKSAGLTTGGNLNDLEEVVDEFQSLFNSGFDNKAEFLNFIEIGGIEMKDTIVLGCICLQPKLVAPYINLIPKYTLDGIHEESKLKLNPIITLMLIIDLSGKISLQASFDYKNSSFVEKGFNIQKRGFDGLNGTLDENKGQETYNLTSDIVANVYALASTTLGNLEFKYVKPWVLYSSGVESSDDLKIVLT